MCMWHEQIEDQMMLEVIGIHVSSPLGNKMNLHLTIRSAKTLGIHEINTE